MRFLYTARGWFFIWRLPYWQPLPQTATRGLMQLRGSDDRGAWPNYPGLMSWFLIYGCVWVWAAPMTHRASVCYGANIDTIFPVHLWNKPMFTILKNDARYRYLSATTDMTDIEPAVNLAFVFTARQTSSRTWRTEKWRQRTKCLSMQLDDLKTF